MEILVMISVLAGVLGGLLGAQAYADIQNRRNKKQMKEMIQKEIEFLSHL